MLPTGGTAIIIIFAGKDTVVGRILSAKPAVGIGLISYSLYLWHQPLFAFHRTLGDGRIDPSWVFWLTASSALLAYLTWRFVETPARRKELLSRRTVFAAAGGLGLCFILFGVAGHFNNGYPNRNPVFSRLASNFGLAMSCNGNTTVNSTCATSDNPVVAIMGNSFAMHLVEGFRTAFPQVPFVQLTQDSCQPHDLDQRDKVGKSNCAAFLREAIATITNTESIRSVIISASFSDLRDEAHAAAFRRTLAKVSIDGRQVYIVGPTPSNGVDFGKCIVQHLEGDELEKCDFEIKKVNSEYWTIMKYLADAASNTTAHLIDLRDYLCDVATCYVTVNGTFMYRDSGHLSREGSEKVVVEMRLRGALPTLR